MSKKKRKNKGKKVRRPESVRIKVQEPAELTVVNVRSDLHKTAILTAACFVILFLLYLTQSHWLPSLP